MLSFLADYEQYFGPLRVFHSLTFRTIGSAVFAALIGFLIGPPLIVHLRRLKFGQHYDDDRTGDLARRFDKKNTPTMGGLLIFAAVFVSSPMASFVACSRTTTTWPPCRLPPLGA